MKQAPEERYRAMYDYEAQESNELSFSAGDLILISEKPEGGWWLGRRENSREVMTLPASYVQTEAEYEEAVAAAAAAAARRAWRAARRRSRRPRTRNTLSSARCVYVPVSFFSLLV